MEDEFVNCVTTDSGNYLGDADGNNDAGVNVDDHVGGTTQGPNEKLRYKKGKAISIRFKFSDGSRDLHERLFEAAKDWSDQLNGKVVFSENEGENTVPVTFLGDKNKYSGGSLFLPGLRSGEGAGIGTMRHEIGHLLGLSHEHFNPDLVIRWKSNAEIARHISEKYRRNWSEEDVKKNITYRGSRTACPPGSGFDTKSVMMYQVEREWNSDGYFYPKNNEISQGDINCIKYLYRKILT